MGTEEVLLIAITVGIAGQIKPVPSPLFSIVGGGQQPVHQMLVGVKAIVQSCRVGRRPVKSRFTLRKSASLEASREGETPSASSLFRTKASMGERTQLRLRTGGIAGRTTG